ncbi:hypothetical protein ACIBEA_14315 [Streptomyces sp. NPDC051555]|uniref:hypothetical protein n=1 Tax=Streptomyces sp. NPDC051555 TaxID=3365657 RepID=UPI00378C100D
MEFGAAFPTDGEAFELVEQGEGLLHHVAQLAHALDVGDATLWGNALAVPELADRVHCERRADLESRDGKPMALFFLSKIVGPHAYEDNPLLVPARREASRLVAELQAT